MAAYFRQTAFLKTILSLEDNRLKDKYQKYDKEQLC